MLRFAILLLLTSGLAPADSLLEQRIDQTIRSSHSIDAGDAGILVVQLGTGKTLYSREADKLFTPASNTKLFTTALALTRLGPDYRMFTRIWQSGADLIIAGGGDPSMSFIQIPFSQDAEPADPMAAIESFADQIVARGIRSIDGDIVGDDTAYPFEAYAPGWGVGDPLWEYGAPVSALSLGSNSIRVDVIPGVAGEPATLQITPAIEYFVIANRVRTAEAGPHRIEVRMRGGRELELSGTASIKAGVETLWLAVDDPALYTATALYDALTRRGVSIAGHPVARHRYDETPPAARDGAPMAERSSPPLAELLRVTDKVSQNLWAELMLREAGRAGGGDGSRRAGLKELQAFLKEIGVAEEDYAFDDGSGLSRNTLVKPAAIVRLLQFMYASPNRDTWVSLMPIGGQDGTLAKRFSKDPAAKSIHAKTGSLSHVAALSGYADSATYGIVAFSVIVNKTNAPAREVRDFIDRIGMILLD